MIWPENLKPLNIDEKQAKVYLALLELGGGTVQEAAQKSGVKRTSIYNFLDKIKNQGLVKKVKKGRRLILMPADPAVLLEIANNQASRIKAAMPELMSIFNLPSDKPKVRFYEGVEDLKLIYGEISRSGEKKLYILPNDQGRAGLMGKDFEDWFWQELNKQGKEVCFLREIKQGKSLTEESGGVPSAEIIIYGSKAAFIKFQPQGSALVIEDLAIAKTLKTFLELDS